MKKTVGICLAIVLIAATAATVHAQQRDGISIVGSSTVYPFATVVAEKFGKAGSFKAPKIESTGTGGGFKLFCGGVGVQHPDMSNASRAIKASEFETCKQNGVTDIVEVKIGYDGIVVANSKKGPELKLTTKDIFLALAKEVPDPKGGESLVANPYKTWKDVNAALPDTKIEVLGPPPTSGTRDAFVELGMEAGALKFDWLKKLSKEDAKKFQKVFSSVREDGAYVEAGENDNLIVQKLGAKDLRIQLPRPEQRQAPGRLCGGQPAELREHRQREIPAVPAAVLLRQEGARGGDPRHQGVSGRIHQREGLGEGRLPQRERPHSAAGRRAQAGGRERQGAEAADRSEIGAADFSQGQAPPSHWSLPNSMKGFTYSEPTSSFRDNETCLL